MDDCTTFVIRKHDRSKSKQASTYALIANDESTSIWSAVTIKARESRQLLRDRAFGAYM